MSPSESEPRLDFLVIGGQRCGTTSMHEYLRGHPQIVCPSAKEAPFFSDDALLRDGWSSFAQRYFDQSKIEPGIKLGKVTPQYMAGSVFRPHGAPLDEPARLAIPADPVEAAHLIPRRIYGVAPGVRLVAILRDPVERAISGYRLARMMGWEHRTPDEAFNEELRPEALERARRFPSDTNSYVVLGEYKRILDGFTDVFDPKQVLIVPFVELQNRPLDVVRRLLRFLGVDVAYVPAGLGHRHNWSADRRRFDWIDVSAWQKRLSRQQRVRGFWRKLPPEWRAKISRGVDAVAYTEFRLNRVSATSPSSEFQQIRRRLHEHYEPWNEALLEAYGPVDGVTR